MATVFGSGAADTIAPSNTSGAVTGGRPGSGADIIYGYGGADLLDGGGGAKTIQGGLGDDTIYSSGLGESLDGGGGTDSYVYAGSDWIVVDLGTGGTGFATKFGVTD